jgi:hypothetical protein
MTLPRRNRGWIWFFVVLIVLTVIVLVGLNMSIRGRQLTLEQLQQARAVWDQKGPRDYNVTWIQKGSMPGEFHVKVRNGKAILVTLAGSALEERLYPNYTMTALFAFIEDFLREDAKLAKERRTFTTATFDAEDGHVTRFIRRVLGTSEQQDISIDLTLVAKDALAAGCGADGSCTPVRVLAGVVANFQYLCH